MTDKQRFITVKALVGAFDNQEALVGAFSRHSPCLIVCLASCLNIFNKEKALVGALFGHCETS